MSNELERSRSYYLAGRIDKAVDALEGIALNDQLPADELRSYLDLAEQVRSKTDGRLREDCDHFIGRVNLLLADASSAVGGMPADEVPPAKRRHWWRWIGIACTALAVLHFVGDMAHALLPDQKTPSQTSAQQYLASATTRLRQLSGQNVQVGEVASLSMTTSRASGTVSQSATLDLDAPSRGRLHRETLMTGVFTALDGGGTVEHMSAVTANGGTTTYWRDKGKKWHVDRSGDGKADFAAPQATLLAVIPELPNAQMAGVTRLAGESCIEVTDGINAPTWLQARFKAVNETLPSDVANQATGSATLWIDGTDSTVLRLLLVAQAGNAQVGQWRCRYEWDFSGWGKPITPPIVLPTRV